MRLYRAQLCAVDHDIPFFEKRLCRKSGILYYYNIGDENEKNNKYSIFMNKKPTMIFIKDLIVYLNFFGKVQDVMTETLFPKMTKLVYCEEGRMKNEYYFTQANQRLYVQLGRKMTNEEQRYFYETLSTEEKEAQKQFLANLIEEEQQYWNPIPGKKYVKKIEQM